MSVDELMLAAVENTAQANRGLADAFTVGQERPVPAALLTQVLVNLRHATSAVQSLEQMARGVPPPKLGD